jgi:D-sedoheptulose 7-phosphate isomerase
MATATKSSTPRSIDPAMLREVIVRKRAESMRNKEPFCTEHAPRIVECAAAMAQALDGEGRLFVMGNGGSSYEAAHVSVELMHTIIKNRPERAGRPNARRWMAQARVLGPR